MRQRQHGQTTLEYAITAAILISAFITIQVYIKRGFMGNYHELSQSIGDVYAPGRTVSSNETLTQTGLDTDVVTAVRNNTATQNDPEKEEQTTTVDFASTETVTQSGGHTVTIDQSQGLFP